MSSAHHIKSAYSYADRARFEEAWDELQAVRPEARDTNSYLWLLGSVASALGKWHEAAEANRRLVALEPILLHWMCWGVSVRRSMGPLAAAHVWAEAARRNPEVLSYSYNHAATLCEAGQIGNARRVLTELINRAPATRDQALDDGRFEPLADTLVGDET